MFSAQFIQNFIDMAEKAPSFGALQDLLGCAARDLGFDFFALVQHVNLSRRQSGEVIGISTYPENWIETFVNSDFVGDDPIHLASHRVNIGFEWDDVPKLITQTDKQRQIRETARKAGVDRGYTVPANIPGESCGSCSFALRPGREMPSGKLQMASLIGSYGFHAARRIVTKGQPARRSPPKLTPRLLECLIFTGQGKGAWEISQILGLSTDTVVEYLNEARSRYEVGRRIQAVILAVLDGYIALSDLAP